MKKIFAGLTVSLLAASIANASDYQFDVAGLVANRDYDNGDDSSTLGVGIEFHFVPVDTSKGPLAEAAFINKSSNISAMQYWRESDDFDSDLTIVSGELYIPNTMFYVGLDYAYLDGDGDINDDSWTLTAGLTPIENLLVTTSYNEDVDYEPNVAAKYLFGLSNGATLVANGRFVSVDNGDDTISAGLDYYFNRYTGVGFNITDTEGNQTTEVHIKHFFLEDAYAGLSYSENDYTDTIAISGGFRF